MDFRLKICMPMLGEMLFTRTKFCMLQKVQIFMYGKEFQLNFPWTKIATTASLSYTYIGQYANSIVKLRAKREQCRKQQTNKQSKKNE